MPKRFSKERTETEGVGKDASGSAKQAEIVKEMEEEILGRGRTAVRTCRGTEGERLTK